MSHLLMTNKNKEEIFLQSACELSAFPFKFLYLHLLD